MNRRAAFYLVYLSSAMMLPQAVRLSVVECFSAGFRRPPSHAAPSLVAVARGLHHPEIQSVPRHRPARRRLHISFLPRPMKDFL